MTDVTLYLFLYPIFEGSAEKVQGIWCSDDKVKAWDDLMLNGVQPAAGKCEAPKRQGAGSGQETPRERHTRTDLRQWHHQPRLHACGGSGKSARIATTSKFNRKRLAQSAATPRHPEHHLMGGRHVDAGLCGCAGAVQDTAGSPTRRHGGGATVHPAGLHRHCLRAISAPLSTAAIRARRVAAAPPSASPPRCCCWCSSGNSSCNPSSPISRCRRCRWT